MHLSEQKLVDELVAQKLIDSGARDAIMRSNDSKGNVTRLESSVDSGLVSREAVLAFLKSRIGLLLSEDLAADEAAIAAVPFRFADHYGLLPLNLKDGRLRCALSNPFDSALLKEVEAVIGYDIDPAWAFHSDIREAQRSYYGVGARLGEPMSGPTVSVLAGRNGDSSDYAVKFVEEMLIDAQRKRATDIHIEPYEGNLRLRYRVDGVLYDQSVGESFAANRELIIARLKVLAHLDLADKRRPQDGRVRATIANTNFDVRVSVLPTQFGETVGLRLLNRNQVDLDLEELGFTQDDLSALESSLSVRNGMVLVTGPTGSGKTTSLYNFLRRLNSSERKIVTIEDPIEYQLRGITQLQVNPQIGFTFANGLRAMLRHDPDIMMVGEVRDPETAKIAIQVALTGHLVFSTVHTNDAASAITRLQDMGVERYLLAATLECVVAQRLVRCICPKCRRVDDAGSRVLEFETFVGDGCKFCNNTGYYGRTGVFEILRVDRKIKDAITSGCSQAELSKMAAESGMRELYQSGLAKVRSGITSYEEVLRVLQTSR